MPENKTKPTKQSVTTFINALTDPAKRAEAKAIIGFGSYHYTYDSGREGDMPLIGFSPRKAATVLYNAAGFSGSEALLGKLGKYKGGKGCLYIKRLADVNQDVLETLAVKSVAATRARHRS
jgi:hypothetical protein